MDGVSVRAPRAFRDGLAHLLNDLNDEQYAAVTYGEGPLLVVAGAGTGKTQVITRRVAWLIAEQRALPEEILALTFTDRAAEEMQGRVDRLVPYGYATTPIKTFHAWGDELLRENSHRLGISGELRVLGRAEVVLLLREHLFELGLSRFTPLGDPTRFLSDIAGYISRAKEEAVSADAIEAFAAELRAKAAAVVPDAEAPAKERKKLDEYAAALTRLSEEQGSSLPSIAPIGASLQRVGYSTSAIRCSSPTRSSAVTHSLRRACASATAGSLLMSTKTRIASRGTRRPDCAGEWQPHRGR